MYDPHLENYNLPELATAFVGYFKDMAQHYRQPIVQMTMGSDFMYINADIWYRNLDKLMEFINNNPEIYNMQFEYSTPHDYIKAIHAYNATYPSNIYDFMPYADNSDSYWTGYFTSRVADKGQVRYTGRWIQSVRTYMGLLRLTGNSKLVQELENEIDTSLFVQEQALGVLQHHDAVSGTAKQYVQNDYYFIMNNGTVTLQSTVNKLLHEQTQQIIKEDVPEFVTCNWNYTASDCPTVYDTLLKNQPVLVTVLNPSQINDNRTVIRIKVPKVEIEVKDQHNNVLTADLFCLNSTNSNDCTLFFSASELPAF